MKTYQIIYQPFATSTAQASDIVIPAKDEDEAKFEFQLRFPHLFFVEAKEQL